MIEYPFASLQFSSGDDTQRGEEVVRIFGDFLVIMMDSTRVIAGILNPIGSASARRAEEDLRNHLQEIRSRDQATEDALARITPVASTSIAQ